jgi:hypothetical protein
MATSQRIAATWNDVQLKACNEEISQQCTMFSAIFLSYALHEMDEIQKCTKQNSQSYVA